MKKKLIVIFGIVIFVVVFGLIFWFTSRETAPEPGIDPVRISREVERGNAVLLDVRTDTERTVDGYAAGSTHFDLARLEAGEMPDYPRTVKIYAYCKGGVRAESAKEILEENDFTKVENIGGLVDWEHAGGEVVRE